MGEAHYLALDPGGTTGWATFREDGTGISYGQIKGKEEFYDWLIDLYFADHFSTIICEDWLLQPYKAKEMAWNKLDTVRIIGAVELFCYREKVELVHQPNTVKGIAYKWAGLTPPKNHNISHEMDAYVHGVYYLQKNGIRQPQQGRAT